VVHAVHELMDRDLQMHRAGVGARGLAVELAALGEDHLDARSRELVGKRHARDPTAHDQHVGLHWKRPGSSSGSRAIAASATGRAGRREVGNSGATPWRLAISAAIWRWQLRPWQRPIDARVSAFTTAWSDVVAIASSSWPRV